MRLEVVLQSREYLIICLSIDHAILLLMNYTMNKIDQTSLLNVMESGILSELKPNQKACASWLHKKDRHS
jgi:hypothetical protein